ncbi:MAG TPA: phage portal protein, partial [Coriobacteriia bacterium]|nr:phage portal protein [Coriobacteriia bacterium]
MSILASLFAPPVKASAPRPDDAFWYRAAGPESATGVRVSADTAMRASAVWGCVRLISETVASLPLSIYSRTEDGGRKEATQHPIYTLLHYRPNRLQTSTEFVQMLTASALLRGNGYAEIVPGPRGPVDQLLPLHPDRVTPEETTSGIRYRVMRKNGQTDYLLDEDLLHLRGITSDGLLGLSIIEYARETVGLALATESYGARLFSQNARPGGVLTHPSKLNQETADRIRASWQQAHAGLGNAHAVAVLEEGMKFEPVGMTNEDAQFLATREFQAEEIARWFGVPPHMIGLTSKSTSWGSGIEAQSINFLTYTLLPWLRRWEQTIARDLIVADGYYFAKFNVNGLLRGDSAARSSFYSLGRQWGYLSVNDIRGLEDLNPVENGDIYLQPLNMVEAGTPPAPPSPAPAPPATGGARAHHALLVQDAAARIIRREVAALTKAAQRTAADASAWSAAVAEFYTDHAQYVSA